LKKRSDDLGAIMYSYGSTFGINNNQYTENRKKVFSFSSKMNQKHQLKNISAVFKAAAVLKLDLTENDYNSVIHSTVISGRYERMNETFQIFYDVAHNEASFTSLLHTINQDFAEKKITLFLSFMKDKDTEVLMKLVQSYKFNYVYLTLPDKRSFYPLITDIPTVKISDTLYISEMIKSSEISVFCGTFRMYQYMSDIITTLENL
jgi:folylpolyglutamate synthase/dihydropteroate synthase